MAKDLLFATLDPTLRQLSLPQGTHAILSDTVGFVSNLPTHLVAAFRATLEEVIEAELILHVRDIAHPDSEAQAEDVYSVLDQLGIAEEGHDKVIEVWNKIDQLDRDAVEAMKTVRTTTEGPLLISAVTGEGVDELLSRIEGELSDEDSVMNIVLPLDEMTMLPWIYENAHVISRQDADDGSVILEIRAGREIRPKLHRFMQE
jgi:GTP-binding protein HflX